LEWVSKSKDNIGDYMASHRTENNIDEVKTYFNTVIDWVSSVFKDVETEMRGLEWGRLYEEYHSKPYNPDEVSKKVQALYADGYVKNRKGIFEFVLGGSVDTKLLDVRIFDKPVAQAAYRKQTSEAEDAGKSNCPICAEGHEANQTKVWKFEEMDADHVSPWSKGGQTTPENCQMLCKTHNRMKGNR